MCSTCQTACSVAGCAISLTFIEGLDFETASKLAKYVGKMNQQLMMPCQTNQDDVEFTMICRPSNFFASGVVLQKYLHLLTRGGCRVDLSDGPTSIVRKCECVDVRGALWLEKERLSIGSSVLTNPDKVSHRRSDTIRSGLPIYWPSPGPLI
jgi:hypothetical protein